MQCGTFERSIESKPLENEGERQTYQAILELHLQTLDATRKWKAGGDSISVNCWLWIIQYFNNLHLAQVEEANYKTLGEKSEELPHLE